MHLVLFGRKTGEMLSSFNQNLTICLAIFSASQLLAALEEPPYGFTQKKVVDGSKKSHAKYSCTALFACLAINLMELAHSALGRLGSQKLMALTCIRLGICTA